MSESDMSPMIRHLLFWSFGCAVIVVLGVLLLAHVLAHRLSEGNHDGL